MGAHRFDPVLSILCGINSCTEKYKNFESFRSHVYRKHREALVRSPQPGPSPAETDVGGAGKLDQEDGEDDIAGWEDEGQTPCRDDPKRLPALFLLKTREERKVTQTALNGIVQDFGGIWRDAMERLQVSV